MTPDSTIEPNGDNAAIPPAAYSVLVFDAQDTWQKSLLKHLAPDLDRKGVERLGKVLSKDCKSVVIEREYIDKDYRDTFSHFHSKRFSTPPARCVRLHFFSVAVSEEMIVGAPESEAALKTLCQSYLGYSVIRFPKSPEPRVCIWETFKPI